MLDFTVLLKLIHLTHQLIDVLILALRLLAMLELLELLLLLERDDVVFVHLIFLELRSQIFNLLLLPFLLFVRGSLIVEQLQQDRLQFLLLNIYEIRLKSLIHFLYYIGVILLQVIKHLLHFSNHLLQLLVIEFVVFLIVAVELWEEPLHVQLIIGQPLILLVGYSQALLSC